MSTHKWTIDPENPPGPRQVKAFNKAMGKLRRAGTGTVRISGVHGQPETQMQAVTCMMSAMTERVPLSIEKEDELGKAHGWTVSRKNAKTITDAANIAEAECDAARPVVDERKTPEEDAERKAAVQASMAKQAAKFDARKKEAQESWAPILAKRPPNATALIVAELDENQSDIMTDYFAHGTVRRVAIGWRTGQRESFVQLRRAAATFPPTKHLGPQASDDVEHRDNYSMGAGNYLKSGHDHNSGWRVRSHPIGDGTPSYVYEDAIPEAGASTAAEAVDGDGYSVQLANNKRGPFWLVVPAVRVERTEFERLRGSAKAAGGWYSRKWGRCPGGFGFSSEDEAQAWAARELAGGSTPEDDPTPGREREAERLEGLADRMQKDIDDKRAPLTQNWTPRRGRIKDGQKADADRMEQTQRALRGAAGALRDNSLPSCLASILTKAGIDKVLHAYKSTPQQDALRELIANATTDEDREAEAQRVEAEELQKLEDEARTRGGAGFFPTPPDVVRRMIEAAGLEPGERYNFLEPSAGIGSIADQLRPLVQQNGGGLVLQETAFDLHEILEKKGYDREPGCMLFRGDFLECADYWLQGEQLLFDRILMNPPFEKGQDVLHVEHAMTHLAEGGRLVALMTPGGADTIACRYGATVEPLPSGSFTGKDSFRQTGVNVCMVTVDA